MHLFNHYNGFMNRVVVIFRWLSLVPAFLMAINFSGSVLFSLGNQKWIGPEWDGTLACILMGLFAGTFAFWISHHLAPKEKKTVACLALGLFHLFFCSILLPLTTGLPYKLLIIAITSLGHGTNVWLAGRREKK